MYTRYADVVNARDSIAHRSRSDRCFFCYRYVRSACRDDRDRSITAFGSVPKHGNHSRVTMKFRVSGDLANRGEGFFVSSRHEQIRAAGEYALSNQTDLFGGLALSENDFRKVKPEIAMMIDPRECEVFVRKVGHLLDGFVNLDAPGSHLLEQLLDAFFVHRADCSIFGET